MIKIRKINTNLIPSLNLTLPMKKLSGTLCLLILFCFQLSLAQPSVPVDPLTGKAQVNIPIWNASLSSIQVPISMVYNGGGVKVEEVESTGGIGWTLVAGGQITRELRGLPDDYDVGAGDLRKGWLSLGFTNTFTPGTELANWTTLNSFFNSKYDTEPDIFTISAPGLSGKFVFDNSHIIRMIPYQDLKITYTKDGNNRINAFTVTTNSGIKYLFNLTEQTSRQAIQNGSTPITHFIKDYNDYSQKATYNHSWKLTQIIAPAGEVISLSYINNNTIITTRKVQVSIPSSNPAPPANTTGPLTHLYSMTDYLETRTLSGINYGTFSVIFGWSNNLISFIEVKENTQNQVKRFSFVYRGVKYWLDNLGSVVKYFLKQINEEGNCTSFPAHSFEYYNVNYVDNTTTIPFSDKTGQDYWGYYNGQPAASGGLIPRVYLNEGASNGERFRIAFKAGYTLIKSPNIRTVNPNTVYYGSLSKIVYPAGGFAAIQYEAAAYNDFAVDTLGGGVRVKQVVINDGDTNTSNNIVTDYEYKLANGQSSGRLLYNPAFCFADGTNFILVPENLSPSSEVQYERVTVKQPGKGSTVYQYFLPGVYPNTSLAAPYTDFAATLTKVARNGTAMGNLKDAQYYAYPFPFSTNYEFEQGLLSRVSEFAEGSTQPLKEKILTYKRLPTPVTTITATKFDKYNITNTFSFGQYKILANLVRVLDTEQTLVYDPANLSTSVSDHITYTYNTANLLSEITKTNSNNDTYKTKILYAKDFSAITNVNAAGADTTKVKHSQSIKRMNDAANYNMHGVVIEETNTLTKSGTESFLSSWLTLFSDFSTGAQSSPKILPIRTLQYNGEAGFARASVATSGSYQEFNYSTKYRNGTTFNAYDGVGNLLSSTDLQRNTLSTHMGYNNSLPVATIANAKPNEVVFSNFDTYSRYQFNPPYTISTDSWSGHQSVSLTSSASIRRDAITNAVGSSGYYRFTCRAKATTGTNISVKAKVFNGTSWIETLVTYPASASGKWIFLDKRISMTGIPTSFSFEVGASANILVDDIAFYPERAELTTVGYQPLYGVSSVSDTRGNTQFKDYDELGRLKYIRNTDRDVVQVIDYKYKNAPLITLKSNFTISSPNTTITAGNSRIFTAPVNCVAVNYTWKVNGSIVGSNALTLDHTFYTAGEYFVELLVSQTGYEPSTSKFKYQVYPPPLNVTLGVIPAVAPENTYLIKYCDNGGNARTFTVNVTGCLTANMTTYSWYYKTANDASFVLAAANQTGVNYTFNYGNVGIGWENRVYFEVMCVVTSSCTSGGSTYSVSGSSSSILINYDTNSTHNCL